MTEIPEPPRRFRDRLWFQLAFMLAVVLVPLSLVSMLKSFDLAREVRAHAEATLLGETMQAASAKLQVIQEARGAAEILANTIAELIPDDVACSRLLSEIAADRSQYALIAFVPVDGFMRCSSFGRPVDLSNHPVISKLLNKPIASFFVNKAALTTPSPVFGVSSPVFDAAGTFLGVLMLSVQQTAMNAPAGETGPKTPTGKANTGSALTLFTFDRTGEVLTSSAGLDDLSDLPRDRSLSALFGAKPVAFTALSEAGTQRVYSVVPLVPTELYALGTQIATRTTLLSGAFLSAPIVVPVLMWLASLIVAWLAIERLVTRNIRLLAKSITSFAAGNRIVGDINLGHAPMEIRDIAQAYESMTESIMHDEAELENTIHQKEVLLREVHHRVKNSLQLIASIMNMQVRRVKSSETQQMLTELRDRIMSLATIHRELFETSGRADIYADELLTGILRQFSGVGIGPDRRFAVQTDLASIRMVPDQAVPLGLLVGEALTSAIKHGTDEDQRGVCIQLSLRREGEKRAVLEIVNSSARAESADPPQTGLGTQLIAAFAMQLRGKVDREQRDGRYHLRVAFPLTPLSEAEARGNGPPEA